MKKLTVLLCLLNLSQAMAAKQTIKLTNTSNITTNYCTDDLGLRTDAAGVLYANGVTTGACPAVLPTANQLTRGSILWIAHDRGTLANQDLTQIKNIFGRISYRDTIGDYPYKSGSTPKITVPAGKVIIAQMNVPLGIPSTTHFIEIPSYEGVSGVTISISQTPGDFHPSATACLKVNAQANDAPSISIRVNGIPNNFYCPLTSGQTYYINYKFDSATRTGPITLTWN